jgi:hypothetical protein
MSINRAPKTVSLFISMAAQYGMAAATFAGILAAALLCSYGSYARAASIAVASVALGLLLSARVSLETLILLWFVATPVASFYLRFPAEKTIVSFDRAVFALALLMLIFDGRRKMSEIASSRLEISWALLSLIAIASAIIESNNTGYGVRIAVDSFWLPLLAFHIGSRHLDLRARASALVLAAIALSFFLLASGAYELRTGMDLFQYPGSRILREGEIRVNGPFISDSSYAVISMMLGIFLWSAPAIFRVRLDGGGRLVHILAVCAALVAALLPLFRAVVAAMIVCFVFIARYTSRGNRARAMRGRAPIAPAGRLAITGVSLLAILAAFALAATTSRGQRLMNPYNLIGRLSTWESAAKIALENPLSGVGLANYTAYFQEKYRAGGERQESVLEVRAANTPHSNPLWIAAELGAVAFVLYLAANVYILKQGLSALHRAATFDQRAAAICYLALAIAYWIPGLTLSSGVYSDLNLYFFFLLGLLSRKFSPGGDRTEIDQADGR